MMMLGMYILNKGRNSMDIIFKLLMFVGAGILIYNAAARPENTFLFSTVGVLLIMFAGFMVLKSNRSKDN